ncbi:unnamed protein product [Oppiella nova]|uniref:Protein kinase domain-containing protein n=1 Tax=Oppiella nova TaxID=334625 RepID=A0A7R9MAL6_9ACAR|nr:unnamed protein product [Oppiella nova]CAG2173876.1 unnamed protein product [Oppiella nova]
MDANSLYFSMHLPNIIPDLMNEILECVQYLHELNPPVIDRDLKPGNILVAKTVRNGRFFKICDFGLATVHQHSSYKGDLGYQAPEVGQEVDYNHKIDVYSLAIIAEKDIFGINLDDELLEMYSYNEIVNKCVLKLTQVLHSMSYYNFDYPDIPGPHWTDRPECSQSDIVSYGWGCGGHPAPPNEILACYFNLLKINSQLLPPNCRGYDWDDRE